MKKITYLVFLCSSIIWASVSFAQSNAELQKQFEELFQKNYQNPKDVDAAFAYAEVAVKLKDYEAAIPPLERILMFNPKLDDVRSEIGVLYYRLKAYKTASVYLNKALEGNNLSKENKQRSQKFLKEIETLSSKQ